MRAHSNGRRGSRAQRGAGGRDQVRQIADGIATPEQAQLAKSVGALPSATAIPGYVISAYAAAALPA